MANHPASSGTEPQPLPTRSKKGIHEPLIIQPISKHTHTAILLHGLGSNGEKFGAEFLESGVTSAGTALPDLLPGMKFIFPTAQKRRSAAFRRAKINQWFNIASLEDPAKRTDLQVDGLGESAKYIRSILSQEIETISPRNIIIGGLSQGCAMALFILLSLEFSVGGFVGMSGWLPFCKEMEEIIDLDDNGDDEMEEGFVSFGEDDSVDKDAFLQAVALARDILSMDEPDASGSTRDRTCSGTPIFLGHGVKDEKIKCKLGEEALKTLTSLGFEVTWKCYPDLGHWYKIPDEIDDIIAFLWDKLGWGPHNV